MSNFVFENRSELELYHYIRKAGTSKYWFDLANGRIQAYQDKFNTDFCVVIYGSESTDDAYIIPFVYLQSLLTQESMDKRGRWMGTIHNHVLSINGGESLPIADFYNTFELLQSEEALFYEDDYEQQPPSDIIAYNELRSCADLYRMYKQGILDIQPDFQREEVWSRTSQTRFIDSLIKQLPIPSMCFSLDFKTQQWQVIDGLQRMSSIIKFLTFDEKSDWKLSRLEDIDPRISGRRISEFHDKSSKLHKLFLRVENLTLPVTVLRCDYSKRSHTDYLFTIFHRLNTGGLKLNNQEIRNCIYNGSFNSLLKQLNYENSKWRKINRMSEDRSYRFTRVELILRFYAFLDGYESYTGRLAKFLNYYMAENREPSRDELAIKENIFDRTVNVLYEMLPKPFPKLSNSVLEAVMFGIAENIESVETIPDDVSQKLFSNLLKHPSLSQETLQRDVTSKEKVRARLVAAKNIFSST